MSDAPHRLAPFVEDAEVTPAALAPESMPARPRTTEPRVRVVLHFGRAVIRDARLASDCLLNPPRPAVRATPLRPS